MIAKKPASTSSLYAEYKESKNILKSLVYKDLFGAYRNSLLGFCWHFIMPFLMLFIYYFAFTETVNINLPNFWVYIGCAIFPFNFMISTLITSTTLITGNAGMIKKMYFPREILVLSKIISSFIVLLIGYVVVLILALIIGFELNVYALLMLPIVLLLCGLFALGYSLLLSSLTVYIRDIQYVLSSVSVAFFFITPMYYTTSNLSGTLSNIVFFNPFTYYIEAFHSCVYYGTIPDWKYLLVCLGCAIITLLIGYIVFKRLKKGFAERI